MHHSFNIRFNFYFFQIFIKNLRDNRFQKISKYNDYMLNFIFSSKNNDYSIGFIFG